MHPTPPPLFPPQSALNLLSSALPPALGTLPVHLHIPPPLATIKVSKDMDILPSLPHRSLLMHMLKEVHLLVQEHPPQRYLLTRLVVLLIWASSVMLLSNL